MVGKLDGKIAIVTGGAQGIGEGIAAVLVAEGARVVIADVNGVQAERTAAALRQRGGEVVSFRADVASEGDVRALMEFTLATYGRLDILVNNAGIGVYKTVEEATVEEFDRCIAVNLRGVFLCCKYAIPLLRAAGGGAIVNIASVHAVQNVPGTAPYAASKGGVLALTRQMALDYGKDRIRINAVCPGWVLTPLTQGIFAASGDAEGMLRRVAARQVLGRIGTPEDIGKAVLYLVSDDAAFVTGTALFVDGGLTAQLETW